MKFGSIVLLLSAFVSAQLVLGGRTTCERKNMLLNQRIAGLYHKNRELSYTLRQKKPAACPRLSSPTYGDLSQNGCSVGDSATVTCDRGYELTGSSVRYCTAIGWNGTEADCVPVTCPTLSPPTSGSVSTTNGTDFEFEAVYMCNSGYELRGNTYRSCLSDGLWSDAAPTCTEIVKCPALTDPVAGKVNPSGPQVVGTKATYTCDFGLVDGTIARYCEMNGTWSGTDPTCASDCKYGESTFVHGDTFESDGGCYLCSCSNGYVDCTTPICQKEPVIVEATQSTEDNSFRPAERALDKTIKTISHTSDPITDTGNPWWMVEYLCPHTFRGVTVWNRHNCCPTHLSNFTVYIDDVKCGQVLEDNPASGGYKTVWCNPPLRGKKVRIQKDEYERLALAEVEPVFNCH